MSFSKLVNLKRVATGAGRMLGRNYIKGSAKQIGFKHRMTNTTPPLAYEIFTQREEL